MKEYDYIEEALNQECILTKLFYDYIQEQMELESDFLLSSLENNIILEAETVDNSKSEEFWNKVINFIDSLFDKFRLAVLDLIEGNKKFVTDELPNIRNFDLSKIQITVIPYWNNKDLDGSTLNDKIKGTYIPLLNVKKPPATEISNYTTSEAVEKYDEFGKLLIEGKSFAESVKIKFLYGFNTTEPFKEATYGESADEDSPNKVAELKKICIDNMLPYVINYRTNIESMQTTKNTLKREIERIKRETKNQSLGESFSLLENMLFKNTDLYYCLNRNILFEAENEADKKDEDTKAGDVVDTSKGEQSKPSTNYKFYFKKAASLINLIIAAEMTSKEKVYIHYMQILKKIYKIKNPKSNKETEDKK